MRRWFLSYNSKDLALIQGLEAALRRKDAEAHIYFAKKSMRAGHYWLPELAKEIAEATVFVLLVGEMGIGDWQVTEYNEAYSRRVKTPDFPVVLVLLEGQQAPGLPFLRQLHWIVTSDPASEQTVGELMNAAPGNETRPGALWQYTAPYRGLSAMEEKDSDYFFGRERKTVEVLSALAAEPDRLPVLIGNSGVGKSSLAQAGVLAALRRQAWPEDAGASSGWPQAFEHSRRWCFLTLKPGAEPLKALVGTFLDTWQYAATDPERAKRQNEWVEHLRDGKATLRDLLDATERRHNELDLPQVPAFFLYVDQGEELYVRAEARQARRFSEILGHALPDPRLRAMMSMRSDFLGGLQRDQPLFNVRRQIDVPPLREAELRTVVSRPAELLSARFDPPGLVDIITQRAAEDSVRDVGALPLLSYTLDDMWTQMVKKGDGVLRLPTASFALGGVLVERADKFLATHPGAEIALRRVLTLRLASVHEEGEPTRRRAMRSEFSEEEWRLVSELADHPNRLLVTVTPETGETYAEVAHEAIFRHWNKLREWIAAEKDFLVWRSGLESARRAWQATPAGSKSEAVLMGFALEQALRRLAEQAEDIPAIDRDFITQSSRAARRRKLRLQALVTGVALGEAVVIVLGIIAWINQSSLREKLYWFTDVRGQVLTAEQERALKPKDVFKECTGCPEMVVVPDGSFTMGSPTSEPGREEGESQHRVMIAKPFAVAKFELTFDEWDACVDHGDCDQHVKANWGRGRQPAINVSWDDAQSYVTWLSKMTGRTYRLLSEAEWEYAARGVTRFDAPHPPYPWGATASHDNANYGMDECCKGAVEGRDQWLNTAPVGQFPPNAFGLYDMHGNVWEWVADTWHDNYSEAPADGSVWAESGDDRHVVRGGSWTASPQYIRSAARDTDSSLIRSNGLGFRVARTLGP